jgi:uncharacterized membrane protein YtjA (UPF0391 family)
MTTGEVLYLLLVIAGFVGFAGVLAAASWRTKEVNEGQ